MVDCTDGVPYVCAAHNVDRRKFLKDSFCMVTHAERYRQYSVKAQKEDIKAS